MKSIKIKNKIKSFAVTFMACVALIFSTIFSFAFDAAGPVSAADGDGTSVYDAANESGIRFVQVAAGKDFAIGLTFDGKLYGWSLLDAPGKVGKSDASSLGEYYSKIPTQIPVLIVNGPLGKSSTATWSDPEYHERVYNQNIIQIAATETTAAFITDQGFIYTWGRDETKDAVGNDVYANTSLNATEYHYLLMHELGSVSLSGGVTRLVEWSAPYIVNYNYPGSGALRSAAMPKMLNTFSNISLAAGANNYIMVYCYNSAYYSYVWGSLLYAAPNSAGYRPHYNFVTSDRDDYESPYLRDNESGYRHVYKIPGEAGDSWQVTAVAGGYTVGINGAIGNDNLANDTTSLVLKGKNFLSSGALEVVSADASTRTVTVDPVVTVGTKKEQHTIVNGEPAQMFNGTSQINFPKSDENVHYVVNNAIIGGITSTDPSSGITEDIAGTNDLFYGRQAVEPQTESGGVIQTPTSKLTYKTEQFYPTRNKAYNTGIKKAYDGSERTKTLQDTEKYSTITRNAVSLGTDIGYGISEDGKLYAWGDNSLGQSGPGTTESHYSYPEEITISGASRLVSVAAGRQLVPENRYKPFNYTDTLKTTTPTEFEPAVVLGATGFTDAVNVQNGTDYITGVLDNAGCLWIWSNEDRTVKQVKFGKQIGDEGYSTYDPNPYNKFVAVYSGYGHNLFAITALGRVVRITYKGGEYVQEIYDEFGSGLDTTKSDPVVGINNWSVAVGGQNSVEFRVDTRGTDKDNMAKLGSIRLFVDNGVVDQETVRLNNTAPKSDTENEGKFLPVTYKNVATQKRGSLVTANEIGDVYRILDSEYDGGKTYLSTTSTLSSEALEPRFTFKAADATNPVTLREKQRENMFDYDIVYDNVNGVGIEIKPNQSSKNGTVTMYFYIARYDCTKNFEITGNARPADDNALYYDYKAVSVSFVINNTAAYRNYTSFGATGDKCSIPLLDPNNTENKMYSIAVQDVSTGIVELTDFIVPTIIDSNHTASKLKDTVVKKMKTADGGYPDSGKISRGNLNYYLGEAAASEYYNDVYSFLFVDRDADLIRIDEFSTAGPSGPGANTKAVTVTGAGSASRIKIELNESDLNGYNIEKSKIDAIATDFNNVYGIYDITAVYNSSNVATNITFYYDVMQFTAKESTGKLAYTGDSVDTYRTTDDRANNHWVEFSIPTYYEYTKYTTAYKPDTTATDITRVVGRWSGNNQNDSIAVFSQPSLRLKKQYAKTVTSGSASNTYYYYGNAAEASWTVLDQPRSDSIKVGSAGVEIKLSEYVDFTGPYISFSYDNKRSYDAFNAQFPDPLGGDPYVTLTEDVITVKPTVEQKIYFTVTIQRFMPNFTEGSASTLTSFKNKSDAKKLDEKITLVFSFTNIVGVFDSLADINNAYVGPKELPIDRVSKLDVWGGENTINGDALISLDKATYLSAVSITVPDVYSSDLNVIKVENVTSTGFNLVPITSGKATIQFVINVYDKSIPVTILFKVSGMTTVKSNTKLPNGEYDDYTLKLNGTQKVYISTFKTALSNTIGDFNDDVKNDNYTVLYGDIVDGVPQAISFKEVINEGTESEYERDITGAYPPFISNIVFREFGSDTTAYMSLELNEEASSTTGVYRMYVKFVNGKVGYTSYADVNEKGGAVLNVVMKVKSTRLIAKNEDGTKKLTISADVDHPYTGNDVNQNADWYMLGENLDAVIYVPLQYLFSRADISGENWTDYQIFLVSAPEGTAQYFNYTWTDTKAVIIPDYNTPAGTPISISISAKKKTGNAETQVISLDIEVTGISTDLEFDDYKMIWIVAFFSSLGFLAVIFIIRLIIYWRRRAKQRALIKRNQELIKMRDRVHNRTAAATREQVVRTKLKMEDPKYAKMFNDMKKDRMGDTGVTLENADFVSSTAAIDDNGGKKKKKKGGKKSMAELKAELAAKKAAFAQAQSGDTSAFGGQPVDPFNGAPMGGGGFGAPDQGFAAPNQGFGAPAGDFGSPADAFTPSDLDGNAIIFDAPDMDGGSQG